MKKYNETLGWLYDQLPMFQRVGATAMKKDLTNIKKLCAALGNPTEHFPCIHIAGTNGKGSTAHLLSAVMQEHGFKTGLYTSPHYRDFRERIKLNGKLISKKKVIDFVKNNKALFLEIKPSFFEITVALAFDFFAKEKVDIAIIETGLGGRLDSTNIVMPLISIITNISFDHQQFLGNTLAEIAGEKAGIIKQSIPVVVGETQKETTPVFQRRAKEQNAPLFFADQDYQAVEKNPFKNVKTSEFTHANVLTTFDITNLKTKEEETLKVNLIGAYQAKNIQTVLKSLKVLSSYWPDFQIDRNKVRAAFQNLKSLTNFIGRWHLLGTEPTIIADSAHNEDGLRLAMQQLNTIDFQKLHFVLGMVNDKDVDKVLDMLPKDAKYYFAKADIPRGLAAKTLAEKAHTRQLKGRSYTSVKNALRAAKRAVQNKDLIYVGGSTFVVAEVI